MSPVDVSEFGEYTAGEGGGAGPDGGGGLAAHGEAWQVTNEMQYYGVSDLQVINVDQRDPK